MSRGMITSTWIETVGHAYDFFKGCDEYRTETKHAARATQVERQVKKKTYTHDTDS